MSKKNTELQNSIDKLTESIKNLGCRTTTITLAHPDSIMELDMNDFTPNQWFISDTRVDREHFLLLENITDIKMAYYEFGLKYPDRIWKGTKVHEV